jgi:hypothetical protein
MLLRGRLQIAIAAHDTNALPKLLLTTDRTRRPAFDALHVH